MNCFTHENPTRIHFGTEVLCQLGTEGRRLGSRALLLYGQGSVKRSGVYDQVSRQLKESRLHVVEHSGVVGNPRLSHAERGVELVRQHRLDLVVAVGGGSVIDEAKAIAAGAKYDGPLWDFYNGTTKPTEALPVVAVVTLPATASEMNGITVLTNDETLEKTAMNGGALLCPRVSFLDPAYTITLSQRQTAYAAADIVSHLTEGYFTTSAHTLLPQDELIEGLFRSVREAAATIRKDSANREARATLMWCATLGWNGIVQAGIPGMSMPCHALEMPLSGLHDIPHGAGLSIVTPAWMRAARGRHSSRLSRFGERALGMTTPKPLDVANAMEDFYRELGAPLRLCEVGVSSPDVNGLTAAALSAFEQRRVSGYTEAMIRDIYDAVR